jgi:hypothetical protein
VWVWVAILSGVLVVALRVLGAHQGALPGRLLLRFLAVAVLVVGSSSLRVAVPL